MAKIYLSYQNSDKSFAVDLAERLKSTGHSMFLDVDGLLPGADWSKALADGLRSSEVFIVIFSKNTERSQFVLTEVGAAQAYAQESGRMLLIPVIIDNIEIPAPIRSILAIVQHDRNLDDITIKIEKAISAFIGRRAAEQSAKTEAAEKIQRNAADYINIAIRDLERNELRDRVSSYVCYIVGFIALVIGVFFATFGLLGVWSQQPSSLEGVIFISLRTIVVIGLVGACAKFGFSLGKSYASESLKSSDRIHAIRFGEFYLRAFGDKTKWDDLKEVFQHWNIDRTSSFSSLDVSQIDPKIVESLVEIFKFFGHKKAPGDSGKPAKR